MFSTDGGYVAIAERVDGANPLYSVLRSADASLVASIEGVPDAQGWELGPGGRYVALQGPDTRRAGARDSPRHRARATGAHACRRAVAACGRRQGAADRRSRSAPSRRGRWRRPRAELGRPLGRTAAAASVSASADGRRLAFTRADGAVAVLDVAVGAELYRLRLSRPLHRSRRRSCRPTVLSSSLEPAPGCSCGPCRAVPVPPRAALADGVPTARCARSQQRALGRRVGEWAVAARARSRPRRTRARPLAFFGHRGPITAAALNAGRSLAATGGSDGIVRVWDIASGAPTVAVMQPAEGRRCARGIERRWPLRRERRRARGPHRRRGRWPRDWRSCAPTARDRDGVRAGWSDRLPSVDDRHRRSCAGRDRRASARACDSVPT